jgi:hypothetical protein
LIKTTFWYERFFSNFLHSLFTDGNSVDVWAESLEEAEQAAHEETDTTTPVDYIVPNV